MLVIDLHTLQAINILDFVDDVARKGLNTEQAQNVLRIGWAINNQFALVDDLAIVNQHVFLF